MTDSDSYHASADELRELTRHEDPDVALAAELTLKYRYGEEAVTDSAEGE